MARKEIQHSFMKAFRRRLGVPRKIQGFTLVEVVVTTVILAVLAAVAIPAFSSWIPNYRLRVVGRDVFSDFHFAKMGAIKTNKPWAVVFDPGVTPGRYFICSDDNGDGWNGPPAMGGNDVAEKSVNLAAYGKGVDFGHGNATTNATSGGGPFPDDEISFVTPDNTAVFSPKGTTTNLGYVYLSNKKGASCAVGAPSIAGVIVLKKWKGSGWE